MLTVKILLLIIVSIVYYNTMENCFAAFIRQLDSSRSIVPDEVTKQESTAEEKILTDELKAAKDMLNAEEKIEEENFEKETGTHSSPVPDGSIAVPVSNEKISTPRTHLLQAQKNEKNYQKELPKRITKKNYQKEFAKIQEHIKNNNLNSKVTIKEEIKNLEQQEAQNELSTSATPTNKIKNFLNNTEEKTFFIQEPVLPNHYFGNQKLPNGPIDTRTKESPSIEYKEKKKEAVIKAIEGMNQREALKKEGEKSVEADEDN